MADCDLVRNLSDWLVTAQWGDVIFVGIHGVCLRSRLLKQHGLAVRGAVWRAQRSARGTGQDDCSTPCRLSGADGR